MAWTTENLHWQTTAITTTRGPPEDGAPLKPLTMFGHILLSMRPNTTLNSYCLAAPADPPRAAGHSVCLSASQSLTLSRLRASQPKHIQVMKDVLVHRKEVDRPIRLLNMRLFKQSHWECCYWECRPATQWLLAQLCFLTWEIRCASSDTW